MCAEQLRNKLLYAAGSGDVKTIRVILDKNVEVDTFGDDWDDETRCTTPLYEAARGGHAKAVAFLVERGANLNFSVVKTGSTPLMIASIQGHVQVVNVLSRCNTLDLNAQDNNGSSALFLAASRGKTEVVRTLMEASAAVDLVCVNGKTALHVASENGHHEIVKLLVRKANVNLQDNDGCVALHLAAGNGHLQVVQELLAASADPSIRNLGGLTPCKRAYSTGHHNIVALLEANTNGQKESLHFDVSPGIIKNSSAFIQWLRERELPTTAPHQKVDDTLPQLDWSSVPAEKSKSAAPMGVTIRFIRQWMEERGGREVFRTLTTREVCHHFVKQFTESSGRSLVELLLSTPGGRKTYPSS
ncbi:hypothetical protein AC1031_010026 [Aphanomyces cochlioides]|nr:hypothetical protein AC1031_010026 [Aphanomyces cochlioides]